MTPRDVAAVERSLRDCLARLAGTRGKPQDRIEPTDGLTDQGTFASMSLLDFVMPIEKRRDIRMPGHREAPHGTVPSRQAV